METKAKILFKFASRSRPEKCIKGIQNIISTLKDHNNYLIALTLDEDDAKSYNKDFINKLKPLVKNNHVVLKFGTSKNKIDAINRDMDYITQVFDWQILVNFSDDMEFTVFGFDEIIREKFNHQFPDYYGNLHFNDGFQGSISTMTIMGRAYYEQEGFIYNPVYKSLFCDQEYTEIAQQRNKIQYYPQVIFKHNHPANIGGSVDELLKKTESFWDEDKVTYEKRKQHNFYL